MPSFQTYACSQGSSVTATVISNGVRVYNGTSVNLKAVLLYSDKYQIVKRESPVVVTAKTSVDIFCLSDANNTIWGGGGIFDLDRTCNLHKYRLKKYRGIRFGKPYPWSQSVAFHKPRLTGCGLILPLRASRMPAII